MKEQLHQLEEGFCGPTALQWVVKEMGLNYSQYKLAKIMGTTHEDGTLPQNMIEGAKKIGLRAFKLQGSRIEMLGELLPTYYVIVEWMSGPNDADDGHYSILEAVDDKVHLHDETLTIEEFNKKWYDIDKGKRNEKWAMLIWKKK